MLILAFDTTSEVGGVGVFRDHECLARVANDGPANRYSISLFSMVDQAMEEAEARHGVPVRGLADMGLIAVASGPGSFTGIRVGLAAAQGWAKAFGLPVRGVSVLEALVDAAQIQTEWAAPILDAHRGEFFVGLFRCALGVPRGQDGGPVGPQGQPQQLGRAYYVPTAEGWLLKRAELGPFLTSRLPAGVGTTCVIRGHDRAALALREELPGELQWQVVTGMLVEPVARLGLRDYGKPRGAGDLDAYYIRRPDAELPARLENGKWKLEKREAKIEIRKPKSET
jgi:tRNA threonylcarbamoyl adenosine modification protein YeaZ